MDIDVGSYLKFPSYSKYKKLFCNKLKKGRRKKKSEKGKFYYSLPASFSTTSNNNDYDGGPLFASFYSSRSCGRRFESDSLIRKDINNDDESLSIFYENVNIIGMENNDEFNIFYQFSKDKIKNIGYYFKNFKFQCSICLDDKVNILNALIHSCGHAICKNCVMRKLTIFEELPQYQILNKCDLCRHREN